MSPWVCLSLIVLLRLVTGGLTSTATMTLTPSMTLAPTATVSRTNSQNTQTSTNSLSYSASRTRIPTATFTWSAPFSKTLPPTKSHSLSFSISPAPTATSSFTRSFTFSTSATIPPTITESFSLTVLLPQPNPFPHRTSELLPRSRRGCPGIAEAFNTTGGLPIGASSLLAPDALSGFNDNQWSQLATVSEPASIVIASSTDGSLFWAEPGNHAIRAYARSASSAGFFEQPSTASPSSVPSPSADQGRVLYSVVLVAGRGIPGFVNSPDPLKAEFNRPYGLALTCKNNLLIISDSLNHVLRYFDDAKGVHTLAGNGTAGWFDGSRFIGKFKHPHGIAMGKDHVVIADYGNNRIRSVHWHQRTIGTIAGSGQSSSSDHLNPFSASFSGPIAVAIRSHDQAVVVAEKNGHKIRVVMPTSGVTTLAGSTEGYQDVLGDPRLAKFRFPSAVAFDDRGQLLIADAGNRRIRIMRDTLFGVDTFAGSGKAGFQNSKTILLANFTQLNGLAIDGAGRVIVTMGNGVRGEPQNIRFINSQTVNEIGPGACGQACTVTFSVSRSLPSTTYFLRPPTLTRTPSVGKTVTVSLSIAPLSETSSGNVSETVSDPLTPSISKNTKTLSVAPTLSRSRSQLPPRTGTHQITPSGGWPRTATNSGQTTKTSTFSRSNSSKGTSGGGEELRVAPTRTVSSSITFVAVILPPVLDLPAGHRTALLSFGVLGALGGLMGAGPAAGIVILRANLLLDFAECNGFARGDHHSSSAVAEKPINKNTTIPFPLAIWPGYKVGTDIRQFARGAVISGLIFILGFTLITILVGAVSSLALRKKLWPVAEKQQQKPQSSIRRILAFAIFPGLAVVASALALPGVISAALQLILNSEDERENLVKLVDWVLFLFVTILSITVGLCAKFFISKITSSSKVSCAKVYPHDTTNTKLTSETFFKSSKQLSWMRTYLTRFWLFPTHQWLMFARNGGLGPEGVIQGILDLREPELQQSYVQSILLFSPYYGQDKYAPYLPLDPEFEKGGKYEDEAKKKKIRRKRLPSRLPGLDFKMKLSIHFFLVEFWVTLLAGVAHGLLVRSCSFALTLFLFVVLVHLLLLCYTRPFRLPITNGISLLAAVLIVMASSFVISSRGATASLRLAQGKINSAAHCVVAAGCLLVVPFLLEVARRVVNRVLKLDWVVKPIPEHFLLRKRRELSSPTTSQDSKQQQLIKPTLRRHDSLDSLQGLEGVIDAEEMELIIGQPPPDVSSASETDDEEDENSNYLNSGYSSRGGHDLSPSSPLALPVLGKELPQAPPPPKAGYAGVMEALRRYTEEANRARQRTSSSDPDDFL